MAPASLGAAGGDTLTPFFTPSVSSNRDRRGLPAPRRYRDAKAAALLPPPARTAGCKALKLVLRQFSLPTPFPARGAQLPGYAAPSSRAARPGAPAVSPHKYYAVPPQLMDSALPSSLHL